MKKYKDFFRQMIIVFLTVLISYLLVYCIYYTFTHDTLTQVQLSKILWKESIVLLLSSFSLVFLLDD